jgi:hypothetical protein
MDCENGWRNFPADLTGKCVLNIGPWDGFFSFELAKRGGGGSCRRLLGQRTLPADAVHVEFARGLSFHNMYEFTPAIVGTFGPGGNVDRWPA